MNPEITARSGLISPGACESACAYADCRLENSVLIASGVTPPANSALSSAWRSLRSFLAEPQKPSSLPPPPDVVLAGAVDSVVGLVGAVVAVDPDDDELPHAAAGSGITIRTAPRSG